MQYYLKEISRLLGAVHASRVAKNIMKSEGMMWKFLDDPENIPLTNNRTEQQIRHIVVYRKNSYFTQSDRGNIFLERITSLYLTWRHRKLNPFQSPEYCFLSRCPEWIHPLPTSYATKPNDINDLRVKLTYLKVGLSCAFKFYYGNKKKCNNERY